MGEEEKEKQGEMSQVPNEEAAQATAGAASPPEEPAPDLEELKAKVAAAEEKADSYLAQLTRLKADFINFRRRVERERAELTAYANERLLKEFLPILDNLERALATAEAAGAAEPLRRGLAQIQKLFLEVLAKEGVEPLDPGIGKPFDPERQEALLREEGEAEVVLAELERGYRYRDRVLRPTLVKVGPAPQAEEKDAAGTDEEVGEKNV